MTMGSDRVSRWGITWRVAPGYGWIFDVDALEGLLNGSSGRTLKSSSSRRIVRGELASGERAISLFVKIHRPPRFPMSLLRSRGMREYRALREAERRGVRTVRAVAAGETVNKGVMKESYLVTEGLPDCTPLSEVSLRSSGIRARRRIIRSVAVALRKFHDGGVLHRDLHSGNILLARRRGGEGADPDSFIVDLHGAGFRRNLGMRERIKNLVQLDTYYGLVISRTDRLFFLKSYAQGLDCDMKRTAAAVEEGAVRARWRLWRRRRRRYLRARKYTRPLRRGGYVGFVSTERDTGCLRELLADPRGAYGKGRVIKASRTNRVASLRAGTGEHLVIKWHRPPTLAKKAGAFMRASRGKRAWLGARGLAERMIGGPVAVAFVERRRMGFVTESFFVADFLEGAAVLPHYVRDSLPAGGVRGRRAFCRRLGVFLADLHRRGVYHTDLKGSNIMVKKGGAELFYLLDPEAVRFAMRVSRKMAIKNLSRLDRYMLPYSSAADRLATLTAYLAALGRMDLLRCFREAIDRDERRALKNR